MGTMMTLAKCILCKSELNRCSPPRKWGVLITKMRKTEQVTVCGLVINGYGFERNKNKMLFNKSKHFLNKNHMAHIERTCLCVVCQFNTRFLATKACKISLHLQRSF